MKFLLGILTTLLLLALAHYGYSVSMSAEAQYFIQGYIGTAVPVVIGGLLACIGYAVGISTTYADDDLESLWPKHYTQGAHHGQG